MKSVHVAASFDASYRQEDSIHIQYSLKFLSTHQGYDILNQSSIVVKLYLSAPIAIYAPTRLFCLINPLRRCITLLYLVGSLPFQPLLLPSNISRLKCLDTSNVLATKTFSCAQLAIATRARAGISVGCESNTSLRLFGSVYIKTLC